MYAFLYVNRNTASTDIQVQVRAPPMILFVAILLLQFTIVIPIVAITITDQENITDLPLFSSIITPSGIVNNSSLLSISDDAIPDGYFVFELYSEEVVADAVYAFVLEHAFPLEMRSMLVEDICEALNSQLLLKDHRLECPDCDDIDNGNEGEINDKEHQMSDLYHLACGRRQALLYDEVVVYNGEEMGYLEIYEEEEPADIVYKLMQDFCLNHHKQNVCDSIQDEVILRVCAYIECKRYEAIIWQTSIKTEQNEYHLQIFQNEEPADAIYDILYPALSWRERQILMEEIMENNVPYSRNHALVFSISVHIQEIGDEIVLDIFDDGTEPVDQVYDFILEHNLNMYTKSLVNRVLNEVCGLYNENGTEVDIIPILPCTRNVPIIWAYDVYNDHDGSEAYIGTCEIMLHEEPIDVIDTFVIQHELPSDYRNKLFRMACEEISDLYTLLSHEFNMNNGSPDIIYPSTGCSRDLPIVFRQEIIDSNGTKLGTLEVLEDEEVADALARLWHKIPESISGESDSLSSGISIRHRLVNIICNKQNAHSSVRFRCTRTNAIVFDEYLSLENVDGSYDTTSDERYHLVIYDVEEPADKVYAWIMEHELDMDQYYKKVMDVVCSPNELINKDIMRPPIKCRRMAPILFGPQRVTNSDNETIGIFQILYWEEPADAVYSFLAQHELINDKAWSVQGILSQICHLPQLSNHCNRSVAVKYYNDSFTIGDKHIGEIVIWENEEVVDVMYNLRRRFGLTLQDQMEAMARICEKETIHCGRTRAIILRYSGINHKEFEEFNNATCLRYHNGWQFVSSRKGMDDIDNDISEYKFSLHFGLEVDALFDIISTWIQVLVQHEYTHTALHYLNTSEVVLIVIMVLYWELILKLTIGIITRQHLRVGKPYRIRRMTFMAVIAFLIVSTLHVCRIEPDIYIDSAMHAHQGKLPDLLMYEGDEPVDAILRWIKETSKEYHPLARQPIHMTLISDICESKVVNCTRKRAWEEIHMGHIMFRNQAHNITYMNPAVDPIRRNQCYSILNDESDSCIQEQAIDICQRLQPALSGCADEISVHISRQLRGYQEVRYSNKNSYIALELEMDVSQGELFQKAAAIVRRNGLNFVPYHRVDNGTDQSSGTYYIHSERGKRAYAALDAYIKVKDTETREWHDKPCTPMFGGALCGKKDKDGNLKIEM